MIRWCLPYVSSEHVEPCFGSRTSTTQFSPESRRHRIRHNQLTISLETLSTKSAIRPRHFPKHSRQGLRFSHLSSASTKKKAGLTLHKLPTLSSNPGAKTELTYRNTESVGLQSSLLRRKFTTVSNFWDAEILKIFVRRCGAEPIGRKWTVTI